MNIDEQTITTMLPAELFEREFLYSIIEIEEEEERLRVEALAELRAKELGMQQQFKKVLKAYNSANEDLAREYKRANAKQRSFVDLDFDANGRPVASIDNFLKVFEQDNHFAGLKFNLLTYAPEKEVDGKTERWLDSDDSEARRYIEKKYGFHSVQKCDDALRIVFAKNKYHPIRDLVDTFEWDGINRIEGFLAKWTKCENTPYTREVSRLIFAGGIHRLYNPGCKFDDMPVLIGTNQGEGKSTFVRWLALDDAYFTEINEFDGQKGIEGLEGAWICEVGELLALTKTKEQEAVKAFLTRLNDRYRMPFDKRVTDHPRQCIFIGTTNKEQFLTDKTGNRRFYPVKVNQTGYDIFEHEAEIKEDIRLCWAEARVRYYTDRIAPFVDRSLVSTVRGEQKKAVEEDYREGLIEGYLEDKTEVCILELWEKALDMGAYSKPTKKDSNEIALIMQNMEGWTKLNKSKRTVSYGVQRCWVKSLTRQEAEQLSIGDKIIFDFHE